MRRILLTVLVLCLYIFSQAQYLSPSVISVQGEEGTSANYTLNSTVGQMGNGLGITGNYCISQGFNQPYGKFIIDTLPRYTIGEIVPQNAWFDGPTQFYVQIDTSNVVYSFTTNPTPLGDIRINSTNGKFYFLPDYTYRENFEVTFIAVSGTDTVKQTVPFLIMPSVPMEEEYFGVEAHKPLPEDASDDYVTITRYTENGSQSINGF